MNKSKKKKKQKKNLKIKPTHLSIWRRRKRKRGGVINILAQSRPQSVISLLFSKRHIKQRISRLTEQNNDINNKNKIILFFQFVFRLPNYTAFAEYFCVIHSLILPS